MNEIIDRINNLKDSINELEQIKRIKELKEKVLQDKELLNKIEEYNRTMSDELKKEISNNKLFQEYKTSETDINVLILEINSKLKQINDKGKCC